MSLEEKKNDCIAVYHISGTWNFFFVGKNLTLCYFILTGEMPVSYSSCNAPKTAEWETSEIPNFQKYEQ